jgi:hypothetical protein
MSWDMQDANNIYEELRLISAVILKKIGCHTEPHEVDGKGKTRTTNWLPVNGQKRFRGLLYHYTNGVAEVGTMRWGNHPGWGNTGSSWHVTILDRISDNVIGEEWVKIDDEIRKLFPVPTIIMADWRWGTWHGNWTCNTTLGIENRNGGYSGYHKAKEGLKGLGKTGVKINGRTWEPYTREQIVANVNIGRLANGWIDGQLDPDWVLTHQCVWATKMDCGLVYPIHSVRNAVFSDNDFSTLEWLGAHPMAPDKNIDTDKDWKPFDEFRSEAEEDYIKWVEPSAEIKSQQRDPYWVAAQLYRLGFHTGPELPTETNLQKQVRWFQRSTGAYKKTKPKWVLSPDGAVGSKTEDAILRRLKAFNISI